MAEMMTATTPRHTFRLPIDTAECEKIEVSYKQGYRKLVIEKNGDSIPEEMTLVGNDVIIKLTQEETLRFAEEEVTAQIRILTGNTVYSSKRFPVNVRKSQSEKIL